MAKCFDVTGYIEPCNVVRQKYTGRALLIVGTSNIGISGDEALIPTFTGNGITVSSLNNIGYFYDINDEAGSFVNKWKAGGGKSLPVMIDAQNPFGVTVQGNTDSGRVSYTKTIPVSIPATREGKAEEFIMGLQKGFNGSAVIVLETFGLSPTNVKSYNDIFGAYSPIRLDPTSVTRNEYENGGSWSFNLICEEPVPNVVCTMTGLSEALYELNV